MAELTPNVDVPAMEEMVATMAGMAYGQYLRNLVVEKIDDPNHIWDDRVLAMMDGVFGFH